MLYRSLLVPFLLFLLPLAARAQTTMIWSDLSSRGEVAPPGERRIVPQQARILSLDVQAMRDHLAQAPQGALSDVPTSTHFLDLPLPYGGMERFRIMEVSIMHPDLQAVFPMVRTYTGMGVEDPSTIIKLDITPHGFHAMVLSSNGEDRFIDPLLMGNDILYQSYAKKDFTKQFAPDHQGCAYDQVNDVVAAQKLTRQWIAERATSRVGDCQLRTYDLALACTGEYANYHGSNTGNNDKSFAAGAMATSMNRVNGIYERDATLTMLLVAGNDQLIFLDGATDPYSNGNGSAMLGQNITTCNSVIGSANYDIGHVFSTGGGGVAYLNSPCTSNKAGGVTGQSNPVGDPFDIDYVAHEMGHQYGGNHSQNNNCNRASSAAVEVGSGITIMGYAGICAPNVASNSIAMFGGYSMQEIAANITVGNSSSCPSTAPLINQPPVAQAGPDRVIPSSTPFILTGSATDPNGSNVLSYSWEQMDNAVATMPPTPTNTGGPAWVPLLPQSTPVRYMPALGAVITNTSPTWEVLSSVGRTYAFRLTVRDNVAGGGCNDQDNMVVTVNGSSGPFVVTQPDTPATWPALSTRTVTWDVAGTANPPVSCANVDILLSLDGGWTYPITLATATANDGSHDVIVPNQPTTTARIMVRANANIFYDISDSDLTIAQPSSPDYTLTVSDPGATACQPGNATYAVQVGSVLGYSDPVTLSLSGLPGALSANFTPNPVTPGNASTLTISNTGAVAAGDYAFTLNSTSTSGLQSLPLDLQVVTPAGTVVQVSPANGAIGIAGGAQLTWNPDPAALTYDIQVATDPGMNNVVESGSGITGTSFTTVQAALPNTTYYWFVQAVNDCGFGPPSAIWSYTTDDCRNVTVRVVLDRYGSETTWRIEDGNNTVLASGGPYTNAGSNGTYPQPDVNVCLPAGCYTLVVNDSFGDGLCCAFGNGYVAVLEQDGPALTPPLGEFTSVATAGFCVGTGCITSLPFSEDLDNGAGDWLQSAEDDMDWTLLSGATPSGNTGPTGDHTSGSGSYFYTEASNPNFPAKRADLVGPCVDLAGLGTATLTFWYHMNGANMGTLNVDVWDGAAWTLGLWTLTGNQGANWQQAIVPLDAFVGGEVRVRFRGITGNGFASDMAIDDIRIEGAVSAEVLVAPQLWLEGAYDGVAGSMRDDLRVAALLPLTEPYSALGYTHVGGGGESIAPGVLAVTGNNALVDWVVVELRASGDPATVLATRSAVLQRDGDVVDIDGTSPLSFGVPAGAYHVAVRHRNHLACMTLAPVTLSAASTTLDLRSGATATFGTEARKQSGTQFLLWAGDVTFNGEIKYTGAANDRDPILARIGGVTPTATANGYFTDDVDLNGQVRYTGAGNDRDPILQNIGGLAPTVTRQAQLP